MRGNEGEGLWYIGAGSSSTHLADIKVHHLEVIRCELHFVKTICWTPRILWAVSELVDPHLLLRRVRSDRVEDQAALGIRNDTRFKAVLQR